MEVEFTKTEEIFAWVELFLIHIARFCVGFLGIVLILPIPISILLKYKLGVKNVWFLNDSAGGDEGEEWWLKENKLTKGKWSTRIRWWFRNYVYNFYLYFLPETRPGGEVSEYQKKINTTDSNAILQWCERKGLLGKDYTLFRVHPKGKVYFRWSKATKGREVNFGAGGSEFRLRMKPIF